MSETTNTNENVNVSTENTEAVEEEKVTMTKSELDMLLQKSGDKRVSAALAKQEKKNAEKINEANRLARMNEAERYQYDLEQRERALVEKEKLLAMSENRNEASKILAEKGLSLDLADFVVSEDADDMMNRIKRLDKAFKNSVANEVKKRLGGNAPVVAKETVPMTKADFAKLSLVEQNRLYQTDRELYNSLTK